MWRLEPRAVVRVFLQDGIGRKIIVRGGTPNRRQPGREPETCFSQLSRLRPPVFVATSILAIRVSKCRPWILTFDVVSLEDGLPGYKIPGRPDDLETCSLSRLASPYFACLSCRNRIVAWFAAGKGKRSQMCCRPISDWQLVSSPDRKLLFSRN